MVNSASVTGNRRDSNAGNNSVTVTTLVSEPMSAELTYEPSGTVGPGDDITITATFNREFSGNPNITIDTGSAVLIPDNMTGTGDPKVWTFTFTIPPGIDGDATVNISVLEETVSIPATVESKNVFPIKNTGPTVGLTYEPSGPVWAGGILIITATFDQPVTGAPSIAISTPGFNLSSAKLIDSGDGMVWTYAYRVPESSGGIATVTIVGGTDEAGNPNQEATNNTFTIASSATTVELTYQPSGSVRAGDILIITASFDRPVTGAPTIAIDTPGFDLSSAELIDSGDGMVWSYAYRVPEDSDGTATVTISKGTYEAGAPNFEANNNTFTIDNSATTVELTYQPSGSVRAGDTLIIAVTYDKPVTGTPTIAIDTPGIDLSSVQLIPSGNGLVWTYIYQVPEGSDGTAKVTVYDGTDEAGSRDAVATNNTFKIDSSGPTAEVTYEPDRELKPGETVVITVTFSEPVVGSPTIAIDTPGDDTPFTPLTNSGDGKVWTYIYVVPEDSDGQAKITIEGGKDEAGNPNLPATNNTFTIESENLATTVTITYEPDREVRPGETLIVTATLSGPVLGTPTISINTEGTDLPGTPMTALKKVQYGLSAMKSRKAVKV